MWIIFCLLHCFLFFPSYVHRYQLFVLDVTNNGSEKCNAAAYCLHYFAHGCCQQSSFSLHEYAKKRMTSKEIEAKVAFYLAPRWCRKKRLEKSSSLLQSAKNNFSAILLLHEINYGWFQNQKTSILTILPALNFTFLELLDIFKCDNPKNLNSKPPKT